MAIKNSWASGEVLTAADLTDTFKGVFINAQTGTSYTLGTADSFVSISNASGGTVTIPTNATAAFNTGAVVGIMNAGTAGTFTIAGAGGVTVNTTTGGTTLLPLETVYVVKLGTNTWQTKRDPGIANAGLVLISSTTIGSAVSSVAITNVFSSTYDNYRVLVSGGAGSTSSDFNMTIGAANTAYYYGLWGVSYAQVVTNSAGSNATSFANVGTFNANGLFADIMVLSPNLAKNTMIHATFARNRTDANGAAYTHSGFLNNTTQYTDFTLTCIAGTVTGGTIKVYGYRN